MSTDQITANRVHGCIEVGGTTVRIAVIGLLSEKFDWFENNMKISDMKILEKIVVNTSEREKVTATAIDMFKKYNVDQIGISSFGPLDLDRKSPNWGELMVAPSISKAKWQNYSLSRDLAINIYDGKIDNVFLASDVYAASLAEFRLGDHNVTESLVYVTVGTGVGVGLYIDGTPSKLMNKREGGHCVCVRHSDEDPKFRGSCLAHDNCVENYTSNIAIAERLNCTVDEVANFSDDNPVWDKISYYLAQLAHNTNTLLASEKVVFGGGVMNRKVIMPKLKEYFVKFDNGYMKTDPNKFIHDASLDQSGMYGAALLFD